MLFMKANPPRPLALEMEPVSPLNVLSDELRGPNCTSIHVRAAELCSKESIHGKIVDAESSRVQLLAEVIQEWRNILD
jgi:hypothetical protein